MTINKDIYESNEEANSESNNNNNVITYPNLSTDVDDITKNSNDNEQFINTEVDYGLSIRYWE